MAPRDASIKRGPRLDYSRHEMSAAPTPQQPQPPLPDLPVRRPLAPALRARVLGAGIVVVSVALLVLVLLAWLLSLPGAVVTVVVVLVFAALAALLGLLLPAHWVLRLDEDGYRIRGLRSAEARSARWSDVLDVKVATVDGVRCSMIRLRDGRTATLPVDVFAGDPEELVHVIAAQLDRTHGYKRLG
ncbi:hypothetical protein GCM10028771_02120 [Nocardioides marmoraquaticus]